MQRTDLRIPVPGGDLIGWVAGHGPPVLLLHGGPAMSGDYLDPLAEELVTGYQVAWYQQRGIAPSTESGPHSVDQHVEDVAAVLDHLGWDEALVVGHSWGGFLVVAVAAQLGPRMRGAMAVDPLGTVDPATWPQFDENLKNAVRPEDRSRYEELLAIPDEEATSEDALDLLRIVWPGYFANPAAAPAMPDALMRIDAQLETWASIEAVQPGLATALPGLHVPFAFVHGLGSPMPVIESAASVDLLPDAALEVVEGAGHFIWHERPGAVRAGLDRLAARTSA
jgi:pimeloyl-ACP methyl ester carboxylesterase